MEEFEKLLEAAKNHGVESGDLEHEVGDLQDIARYMWSQLPVSCKKRVLDRFDGLVEEWGAP